MTAAATTTSTFNESLEQHMREICTPRTDLSGGIFYPLDYFQRVGERPRTDWLRNRGAFLRGYAPTSHWEQVRLPPGVVMGGTEYWQYFFVLKVGVKPCAALDILKKGLTLVDCIAVTQIALYSALRDQLGDEKFDVLFRRGGPTPLALDRFETATSKFWLEDAAEGPVRQFNGAEFYKVRHVGGSSGGFSTVGVGDDRYLAFGLGERSSDEILQHLAEAQNKPGDVTLIDEPAKAFPYLTPEDAGKVRSSLFDACIAGYGSNIIRETWDPQRKADAMNSWLVDRLTEELSLSAADLRPINRSAKCIRVRVASLGELRRASVAQVEAVRRKFMPPATRSLVNYNVSPPRVVLSPSTGSHRS